MRHRGPILILLVMLCPPAWGKSAAVFRDFPAGPPMVALPASPDLEGRWAIGQTEITFDQWQVCVQAKACRGGQDDHKWGKGSRPIMNITYDDALAYVAWLSKHTGKAYQIPSEAVWSYAAHAGTATAYPWGDDIGSNNANCRQCGSKWGGDGSAPVASFAPNPFGLYDMNGNVWEWTSDCWDAKEPGCRHHVIRGGAWYYLPPMSKTDARARFSTQEWSYTLGLRVVRPLNDGEAQ